MKSPGRIVHYFERPEPNVVAGLAQAGVSTAHEVMGRSRSFDTAIRPVQSGLSIAGPAVTVLTSPTDNLMVHAALETCRAGDIVVIATTAPSTAGMVGELMATSMRAQGAVGLVTDAGVRDIALIRSMGFPVWARHISPQGTTKAIAGSVNVPVVCGGCLVEPGDVIVADDDGVTVVPRRVAPEVLEGCRERIQREDSVRSLLASGTLGLDHYGLRQMLVRLGVEVTKTEG